MRVFYIYFDYTTTVASEALTAIMARHPSCDTMKEPVILLDISEAKKRGGGENIAKGVLQMLFELILRKVTLCQTQRTEYKVRLGPSAGFHALSRK